MLCCWRYCPHERPKFVDLVQRLDAVVSESVGMVKWLLLVDKLDVHHNSIQELGGREINRCFCCFRCLSKLVS